MIVKHLLIPFIKADLYLFLYACDFKKRYLNYHLICDGERGSKFITIQYSRVPIYYSLAYHSMSYSKDDPNYCAKEFLEYLKKVGNIVPREVSSLINSQVLKLSDEKRRRELMMAVNLELVTVF